MAYGEHVIGGDFPPRLNTDDDAWTLKPNESPACYGVDLDAAGFLKTGSVPTGDTAIARTYEGVKLYGVGDATATYTLYHNRLWLRTGAKLYYGAPEYTDKYVPDGLGYVEFKQDSSFSDHYKTFLPISGGGIAVLTTHGAYPVTPARGGFDIGTVQQALAVAGSTYATHDGAGTIYVSNTGGVWAWDGREVRELTRAVRNSLGTFGTATALTMDYDRRRVIGTSKFVVDLPSGALFDYGTSGFLWTSRTMAGREQFSPERIIFMVEHSGTSDGSVGLAWEIEEEGWSNVDTVDLKYRGRKYSRVEYTGRLPAARCHKFRIRLTSLSSTVKIREVRMVGDFAGVTQVGY